MSDELNNIEEVEVEEISLDEDAAASNQATLAMKPTNVSRSDLISRMVAYASQLNKDDLSQVMDSMGVPENDELYSNNSRLATGDMSAKNKATIKSSNAIKEDLALLFGDSSDLSEDFRLKVSTLFEAAVSTRVEIENARLEEEFEAKLEESYNEIKTDMMENIDSYLNYAVAEWIEENKLAVENNIRTQVTESFLTGLKGLFEDHYVEIPEDKADIVESMAERIEELEELVNETTADNIELSKIVNEKEVREISSSLSEGMMSTQKDKFNKLIEAVDYSDADEFRKKANIIKESYFTGKSEVKVVADQLINEEVEEPEVKKTSSMDPTMDMYVSSLSKTIKK
jgi:predicted nuclease with TOPRIM domain